MTNKTIPSVNVRLVDDIFHGGGRPVEALKRIAKDRDQPVETVARDLLEEAIRKTDEITSLKTALIEFRNRQRRND